MKPEILFLKQEDVIKAGLLDMKMVLAETEKTFKMIGQNQIINPTKVFMGMPSNENWDSYCMSMPAYIGGDVDTAGFKWAAESKANAQLEGVPYGIDIVILSDPKTVFPKAILDGTITTAMRTSATAGVMAKYNALKGTKVACLVGAGVIGRTMIMAMMEAVPTLEEIHMVDLVKEKAEGLAKEFEGKIKVVPYTDVKEAVKDAQLLVTETTSRKPFIKKEWLKPNMTVIQMEGQSCEEDILLTADRVVLDNWSQMSHLVGILVHELYEAGKLKKEDIVELPEMVGGVQVRQNEDQFVYCGSAGVGSVDIVIAAKLYENAKKMGIGQKLNLWDNPLWV